MASEPSAPVFPPSPTLRYEVATNEGLVAAILLRDGARPVVRRQSDAGAWAIQVTCPASRAHEMVEHLVDDPRQLDAFGLRLAECRLRVGRRSWPLPPFDEATNRFWSDVVIPPSGEIRVINELRHSPVGAVWTQLHLRPDRPPQISEIDAATALILVEQHGPRTVCSTHAWLRRARWARAEISAFELLSASQPRAGTDWRLYEVLNGYYHSPGLRPDRLPPLPSALDNVYPMSLENAAQLPHRNGVE